MKTFQDCIKFANENPECYLATTEGDQPRVRALGFWFADETGFYFQTASVKEIPSQLKNNPKVEACFYHRENQMGTILRVAGETEFLDDITLKEKAMNDRPFLKYLGLTAQSPELILFRIPRGEAHFWTMENNLNPKAIIRF
ncbi:hypothetical protein EZS27_009089 [termite gut metagenome]|uniref:Pyridoxamine 5'-phosphate oxidase N-terminal domain-containing protein n=1 Tax=termite gut metagenome TaxID=433724 RepID=A0A5J4SAR1_9ZZZZ